jgi:hypothetical protein
MILSGSCREVSSEARVRSAGGRCRCWRDGVVEFCKMVRAQAAVGYRQSEGQADGHMAKAPLETSSNGKWPGESTCTSCTQPEPRYLRVGDGNLDPDVNAAAPPAGPQAQAQAQAQARTGSVHVHPATFCGLVYRAEMNHAESVLQRNIRGTVS